MPIFMEQQFWTKLNVLVKKKHLVRLGIKNYLLVYHGQALRRCWRRCSISGSKRRRSETKLTDGSLTSQLSKAAAQIRQLQHRPSWGSCLSRCLERYGDTAAPPKRLPPKRKSETSFYSKLNVEIVETEMAELGVCQILHSTNPILRKVSFTNSFSDFITSKFVEFHRARGI